MYRVQFPTGTAGVEQRRDEELREPVVEVRTVMKRQITDTHWQQPVAFFRCSEAYHSANAVKRVSEKNQ